MAKQRLGTVGQEIRKRGLLWLPFVLLVVLVVLFELLPALLILINSFKNDTGFTMANYISALSKKYYLQSLKNSIIVSIVSAIVGLAIGTATALCLKAVGEEKASKNITAINMTTNFAGVPLAFAFIILLGTSGIVTAFLKQKLGWDIYNSGFNLFSWTGITLVYIYFQIPLAIMLMYPAVDGIKDDVKEAALMLGASKWKFWTRIGLPILMPSIVGSFTILFANALGAYATAYALVNANYNILSITIAGLVSGDITMNPYLASALAVIMGVVLILSMVINSMLKRHTS